jgi:hypothetical protein
MSETVTKPKSGIRGGLIFIGAFGLSASLFAIAVETARNYKFGARDIADPIDAMISGGTCAMFAGLLIAIPILARYSGWRGWLKGMYFGCMAATAYCGVAYYVDDIRAKARAAQSVTRGFQDAREDLEAAKKDRDRAQAEADAVEEKRPSVALKALYDAAEKKRKDEASPERKGCGNLCKNAEADAAAALKAYSQALAKERAQARADAAQKRIDDAKAATKTGPTEASGMAGLAADLGGNAASYAAMEGLAEPIVKVILLLGAAALLDSSLSVLLLGLGFGRTEEATTGKAAKAAKAKAPVKVASKPAPVAEQQPAQKRTELGDFIAKFVRSSNEPNLSSEDLNKQIELFWRASFPAAETPSPTAVGRAMKDAGFGKKQIKGKQVYLARLEKMSLTVVEPTLMLKTGTGG